MVGVFASWRTQRWITLAFGCVLMLCAGTVYLLPAWSDGLRAQAHLSISSFNTVATGLNAGTWLGVIGGVLYDHVGPKPTGIAAGLLLFLGYFGIKLAVQHYAKTWLITVLALVVGQGSGFFYTVALNTSVKNFGPNSRGKVVGLLVCFFGLCSGIFTVFLKGFFPSANSGHLPQFLLFLALVTSCTGLIATFFQRLLFVADKTSLPPSMHPLTPADATPPPAEPLRITIGYSVAIAIALAVAASSLVLAFSSANPTIFAGVVCGLLPLVFCVALPVGNRVATPTASISAENGATVHGAVSNGYDATTATGHSSAAGSKSPSPPESSVATNASTMATIASVNNTDAFVSGETVDPSVSALLLPPEEKQSLTGADFTLLRSLRSVDYWLLFIVFLCGIGTGITIVNNMFEIVVSRLPSEYDGKTVPQDSLPHSNNAATFLVLFSVCNTFGRLFSGHISDTFARRLPRPAFLVMAALLMAIVQVIFAFASVNLLYLGAVLLGLAYGSFFCLVPTLTAEAFGVVHFGANYGLQGLAPAAGSELLSTLMAGGMADDRQRHHFVNVTSDHGHDHALHCLGPACYRVSLLVNAGLCVFAALIAVVITIRQRTGRADTLLKHSHSAIKQS